jgi:hypothetical protein
MVKKYGIWVFRLWPFLILYTTFLSTASQKFWPLVMPPLALACRRFVKPKPMIILRKSPKYSLRLGRVDIWSGERASRYLWKCQHYLGRVDIWSGERASRYLWKCQHYLVWAKLFVAKQLGLMTNHE